MTAQEFNSPQINSLEAKLRRMQGDSDFPALSGVVTEINRITSSDSASHNQLAKVILQDVALTYKLIKLVNTVAYRQFGRNINTVSKAVVILGFEVVRNMATTLTLLHFLQNKSQASEIKEGIVASLLAGFISTKLSSPEYPGHAEESIICSMFYYLGKFLVSFYYFEQSQTIASLLEDPKITDEQAEIIVLGHTCSELSIAIARSWNFPPGLIAGMRKLPKTTIGKPHSAEDYLCTTVNLANELCHLVATVSCEEKSSALQRLCERYKNAIRISGPLLLNALDDGLRELLFSSEVLEINAPDSALIRNAMEWLKKDPDSEIA